MKNKKIIEKLEAVICELKEDKDDEEKCGSTNAELLCDDDEWTTCATTITLARKEIFITETDEYKYYADLGYNLLYRVQR